MYGVKQSLNQTWTCASWTVGVLGFTLTELKHAIGLAKLNYVELGHAAVGSLGREAVGVLKGRPRLSHHVSHCVAPPAAAIGLLSLKTLFFSLA